MSRWNRKAERIEEKLPTTAGKTENFVTRNVKLITFIICMAVFLAGFIPVGVMGIQNFLDSLEPDTGLPIMTKEDVIRLSEQEEIFFSQITCYEGEEGDFNFETYYTAPVEGGFYLRAVADKMDNDKLLYLYIHKEGSDVKADVLTEDIRKFFRKNS